VGLWDTAMGMPLTKECFLFRCRGNKLLWGYSEDMDPELQEVFNMLVSRCVCKHPFMACFVTGLCFPRAAWWSGLMFGAARGLQHARVQVRYDA